MVGVAGFSPAFILKPLNLIAAVFLLIGLLCVLKTHFVQARNSANLKNLEFNISKEKPLVALWLGQGFLLLITVILFHLFETQSTVSQRFHPIPSGTLLNVLQKHDLSLGLMPWIFFTILGMGLAFFSLYLERPPILYKDVIGKGKNTVLDFIQSMLHDIVMAITISPFIFVTCIGIVWICETVNLCLGLDSLFLKPLKTAIIISLIIIMFRKTNKQIIHWMQAYRVGLGKTLLVYLLGFSFFISLLHGFSDWFTFELDSKLNIENMKSPLLGHFTDATLNTRLTFLIVGWWAIWVPWMSSLVARAAMQTSLFRAVVQSLWIPGLVFGFILPKLTIAHWNTFEHLFYSPLLQIASIFLLIAYMAFTWGKIYTTGDAFRGAMLPIGNLPKGPLNRWVDTMLLWISLFMPGWFILGWMPAQIVFTSIMWFTVIVVFAYLFSWARFVFGHEASTLIRRFQPSAPASESRE